jgi:TadE-like protein
MRLSARLRGLGSDDRGVAAIETALVGSLLVAALMNVVEVSRYAYVSAQVAAATQAAAQSAAVACDPNETPATVNCPELEDAVVAALHGSSLGEDIDLASEAGQGGITEGWYCVTANDTLQHVGGAGSKPSDCSGQGGGVPALYLRIQATYVFQPIFPGLTVAAAFSGTIDRTAWMRML